MEAFAPLSPSTPALSVTVAGGAKTRWEPSSKTISPPPGSHRGAARGPLSSAALASTSA